MSLDFVAIDFETANGYRSSPCAIGLVRVEAGRIVHQWQTLIQPPAPYNWFSGFNIQIHGITPEMVRLAPHYSEVWPEVLARIGDLPVVAHNAAFDIGVLRESCSAAGIPWPRMHYACTLVLARLTYRLFSYGLPFVAKEAGVDLVDHHDALADANAAAQVMIDMASRHKAESIEALLEDLGVLLGELTPEMWAGCRKFFNTGKRTAPVANLDADPDHPLYGQFVSFTGTLQTMRRQEAQERVASVGGTPELSVTRRTTILVEGYKIPQR